MVPAQEIPHHVGGLKRVVIRPFPTFLLVGRSRPIVATISDGEVFNVDSRAAPSPPHAGETTRLDRDGRARWSVEFFIFTGRRRGE